MIVHKFSNGTTKYQCDVCGKVGFWGDNWTWYGSLTDEDTCPHLVPHMCSDKCRAVAERKIKTHEWELPVVSRRGHSTRISRQSKGYGVNKEAK